MTTNMDFSVYTEDFDEKRSLYIKILYELANGIDPLTGEHIDDFMLNHPDVIRALYAGCMALKTSTSKPVPCEKETSVHSSEGKPKNAGKKWTEEDDSILLEAFNNGEPISMLALDFGRSETSIKARLEKLLDISYEDIIKTILLSRQ